MSGPENSDYVLLTCKSNPKTQAHFPIQVKSMGNQPIPSQVTDRGRHELVNPSCPLVCRSPKSSGKGIKHNARRLFKPNKIHNQPHGRSDRESS